MTVPPPGRAPARRASEAAGHDDLFDDFYGESQDDPPRRGPSGLTWLVSLAVAALVGSLIGWISVRASTPSSLPPLATASARPSAGTTSAAPGAALSPALTSFDPLPDGSGLSEQTSGGTPVYLTQQYRTAAFGGLKAGVGLLADFGSATRVGRVTFTTTTPGFTVQLLAGDSAPVKGGASMTAPLPSAGAAQQAAASTTLTPSASEAHRYWMVWIPQLAGSGSTYSAALSAPTFTGAG